MSFFNKKKRIHYLGFNDFWFSVVGILILSTITNYLFNDPSQRTSIALVAIGWGASLFFTICDWFTIRLILIFLRKKYPDFKDDIKRIVLLLLSIVGVILFVDYVGGIISAKFITFLGFSSKHTINFKVLLPIILITFMTMAVYEAVYYYVRLKKSIRVEEQTKQAMIQAQLDTLRNQAQPHFLFNSLNTLRDIIDQDSKKDAKDFVDNLSGVYRFILESGTTNLITLREELAFAKAYIHIQLERFGQNLIVDWHIPESKLSAMIIPMSLQLLLENAIKHNIVSKAKPLSIKVTVTADNLVVSNKIQVKSTQTPSTKIGLINITKRYQLIANTSPIITTDGTYFTVSLPLLTSQNNTYEISNH
ncbi:sensor histidine kinase [Aquimarina sp. W85]|uniref:sensor histidine kinase n=1 Tax=Aquimarina rhodophyticola TaxID=3342246 RepID=UPI00366D96A2